MRFLIIDDDHAFGQILARSLNTQGHDAVFSETWREFPNFSYDVCLLDLRLGDEHSLEHIPELRKRLGEAKIIMLTGFASIATAVQAIKLGANDYLAKPISAKDILQHLESVAMQGPSEVTEEGLSLKQQEWETIQRVLAENKGNISATARQLGMHRRTLQRKLDKKAP